MPSPAIPTVRARIQTRAYLAQKRVTAILISQILLESILTDLHLSIMGLLMDILTDHLMGIPMDLLLMDILTDHLLSILMDILTDLLLSILMSILMDLRTRSTAGDMERSTDASTGTSMARSTGEDTGDVEALVAEST